MRDCLTPFFDAAKSFEVLNQSQFYLGIRLKCPGADLVMFRYDGLDAEGQPRGHGAIFHYSGVEHGYSDEAPKLLTVNNIRNTFLFEVSADVFHKVEGFIDMLRNNGLRNPYYFSRNLNVMSNRERQGQKPLLFDGTMDPRYSDDPCEHFMRPHDSIPMVAVNCVTMVKGILMDVAGVDLASIHPDLPLANNGAEYRFLYEDIVRNMQARRMPDSLSTRCMVFDENAQLAAAYN